MGGQSLGAVVVQLPPAAEAALQLPNTQVCTPLQHTD